MKSLVVRVAATAMLVLGVVAVPTAASAHATCESPQDVPVVIEYGSLEGEDRVVCAQHSAGSNALDALNDAGVETAESRGAMPLVCRIDGQPTPEQETCGSRLDGPGYWAFLVAKEDQDWGYAQVGLQEYELAEGDFVALKYHQLDEGENVDVALAADADTRADAEVPGHDEAPAGAETDGADDEQERSSFARIALPVAIMAALLVATAAFVVGRRRRP